MTSPRMHYAVTEYGVALLDLRPYRGRWRFMDPLTAELWSMVQSGQPANQAIDTLTKHLTAQKNVSAARVRKDLSTVVTDLDRARLVDRALPDSWPAGAGCPLRRPGHGPAHHEGRSRKWPGARSRAAALHSAAVGHRRGQRRDPAARPDRDSHRGRHDARSRTPGRQDLARPVRMLGGITGDIPCRSAYRTQVPVGTGSHLPSSGRTRLDRSRGKCRRTVEAGQGMALHTRPRGGTVELRFATLRHRNHPYG
ncbi:hypothetical protein ACVWXU_000204 [Streptomyces sp. TE33382]